MDASTPSRSGRPQRRSPLTRRIWRPSLHSPALGRGRRSPAGKGQERNKSYVGRLLETYDLEKGIDLSPYGSWTLKSAPRQGGAEPDECYLVGADQDRERPDLAIEVVWTRGGIDKLELCARLGVGEVWFWKDGRIEIHVLRGSRYENVPDSALFPDLDINLLCSFLDRATVLQAVRALRDALRT